MNPLEKLFGPNYRTTLAGILGAVGVICTQAYYYLDNDASTKFQPEIIWAAITGLFLAIVVRDKTVSDEESGIPERRTGVAGARAYQMKQEEQED